MINSLEMFCGGLLLLGSAVLPLDDVYVDTNAPNCSSGTGTAGDPVCTVNAAVGLAAPGDTIHIAPGTYLEHVTLGSDMELVGTEGADVTILDGGGSGGSVVVVGAAATVVVDGVTVTGGRSLAGGGILVGGDLTLRNSMVTDNVVTGGNPRGGGLATFGGLASLTIENSTISNNVGEAIYYEVGNGGGVSVIDAELVIRDSTITGNSVTTTNLDYPENHSFGGGIALRRSTLVMSDSVVSNNEVHGEGGGIRSLASTFDITNSTISGNLSWQGSAIFSLSIGPPQGTSSLKNVTIAHNRFIPLFMAGWPSVRSSGSLEIESSIIAANHMSLGGFDINAGSYTSLGHNLIGRIQGSIPSPGPTDLIGNSANPIDPVLGPLQDNGGPTFTHALLPGSPAIDSGNPLSFEPVDQRGVLRPRGSAPDIGAFELSVYADSCNGDGGDQLGCSDCPCANNAAPGTIGGCLNSAASATRLLASGDSSVSLAQSSASDLRFAIQGAPPNAFCILNSGDALAPTSAVNPCFGQGSGTQALAFDGLRCAVSNTRRHGGRSADTNGEVINSWGGEGAPAAGLAQAGAGFGAGQTRFFQVIHRDDNSLVCTRGLNSSQAVEVTFEP